MQSSTLFIGMFAAVLAFGCSSSTSTTLPPEDTGLPDALPDVPVMDSNSPDVSITDTGTVDTAVAPKTVTVTVGQGGNVFNPANVDINVGDTVMWTWMGSPHSVTEQQGTTPCAPLAGGFDSGIQNAGFTYSHTFDAPGTVNYFCSVHCALGMTGIVTVH
jgi:plastocyanin